MLNSRTGSVNAVIKLYNNGIMENNWCDMKSVHINIGIKRNY